MQARKPNGPEAALLTVAEAATYLRVSATTLRRWMHAGQVPYVLIGQRSYRFAREALDAWIASRSVGTSVGGGGEAEVILRPHGHAPRDVIRALLRGTRP